MYIETAQTHHLYRQRGTAATASGPRRPSPEPGWTAACCSRGPCRGPWAAVRWPGPAGSGETDRSSTQKRRATACRRYAGRSCDGMASAGVLEAGAWSRIWRRRRRRCCISFGRGFGRVSAGGRRRDGRQEPYLFGLRSTAKRGGMVRARKIATDRVRTYCRHLFAGIGGQCCFSSFLFSCRTCTAARPGRAPDCRPL